MNKIIFAISLLLLSFNVPAENIKLTLPALKDGVHKYYHTLLKKALEAEGHSVTLDVPYEHIPQKRIIKLVEKDKISLFWMLKSSERDKKYKSVNVGLTNGLIGHRILFIPKNGQHKFEKIKTLDDFRKLNLVGGFGKSWFDINIWKENKLKHYVQDGEWRLLYKMLANKSRGVDYFSRGFTEILSEAKLHPELDIEKQLVFVYERDFIFYLSPSTSKYADIIEKAMLSANKSGLMDKLIKKYWDNDFKKLNYEKRIKIKLKTPN